MDIERWKLWVSIVDVVSKSAIAGAIGYATYSFNVDSNKSLQDKERFSQETSCWDVIHKTVAFAYSNHSLIGEQINSIKTYLPEACSKNEKLKDFGGVLLSFLQTRKSDPTPTLATRAEPGAGVLSQIIPGSSTNALLDSPHPGLPGQAATTFGSAGTPAPPSNPSSPPTALTPGTSAAPAPGTGNGSSGKTQGWVAVGYQGTPDFNFTLPDGRPITDLAPGHVIEAKWSVYVRPRPAGWDKTAAILSEGQCFKLTEAPKTLKAGTRDQIWAKGELGPCP